MRAHIFYTEDGLDASNGGGNSMKVCVDGKVHLTLSSSWYDQSGDEVAADDSVFYGNLVACDGSCNQSCELPMEAEDLVRKFLASDGKECGEFERTTPRYPNHISRDEDE